MSGGLRRVSAVVAVAFALAGIGAASVGDASGATTPAVVKIVDFRFAPDELTILNGGAVRWVWSSRNKKRHDVYLAAAPSGVRKGSYTSGRAVKNAEFKRTFRTPGIYDFLCSLHPGMHLEVAVTG